MSACQECRKRRRHLGFALDDFQGLRAKAVRFQTPSVLAKLAAAKRSIAEAQAMFDAHVDEAHPDGPADPVGPVIPKFLSRSVVEEVVPEGSGRCRTCGHIGVLTSAGNLRRHSGRSGMPCANKVPEGRVRARIEAPPVHLPERRAVSANAQPRDKSEPSRLDAGSNCRECGKWLPGERSLCGRCYARSA